LVDSRPQADVLGRTLTVLREVLDPSDIERLKTWQRRYSGNPPEGERAERILKYLDYLLVYVEHKFKRVIPPPGGGCLRNSADSGRSGSASSLSAAGISGQLVRSSAPFCLVVKVASERRSGRVAIPATTCSPWQGRPVPRQSSPARRTCLTTRRTCSLRGSFLRLGAGAATHVRRWRRSGPTSYGHSRPEVPETPQIAGHRPLSRL